MMEILDPHSFPTFKLFMGGYWNQMGDEVHGTLDSALEQFVADASRTDDPTEYLGNLVLEAPEVWAFWSKAGGRGLGADDFDFIDEFLTKRLA